MSQAMPTTSDWYSNTGWEVFNELLSYLETKDLNTVYVENFDAIKNAVRKIPRKSLIGLFNEDSQAWKLEMDEDGVLVAKRRVKKFNKQTLKN